MFKLTLLILLAAVGVSQCADKCDEKETLEPAFEKCLKSVTSEGIKDPKKVIGQCTQSLKATGCKFSKGLKGILTKLSGAFSGALKGGNLNLQSASKAVEGAFSKLGLGNLMKGLKG